MASMSNCVMVVNVVFVLFHSRIVVESLKKWKKRKYCPFSKWLSFSDCGHCEKIFKLHLMLDGLRSAWLGKQINWHRVSGNV